ncbi:DNA repair protein RecO [Solemya pervernicosa gill symbiont]|uniref:DNA repair protein RecO n=2 Tax=Gammaproteobacteria incertae sedis TaxID=118884 RepID=A0A1T2LAD2_9GAMM|nr:DNA repair protein RecO [Solemya pervernicosa gill symbiont]QKQ27028.1 DNA repair protein RecO [Candidatus Reidiella endopervernicosa]
MVRVDAHPCYLLHSRPYRESSLILDVFSFSYGRVALIAKGARSSKSRLKPVLTPFNQLLISWSGRGDLYTLREAETTHTSLPLLGSRLISALYLNELIRDLLHTEDPCEDLYDLYERTLNEIRHGDTIDHSLRLFEKHLLEVMGYALILDHEAVNGAPLEDLLCYRYEINNGPVICDCNNRGAVFRGRDLIAFCNENFESEESLKSSKRLTRLVLSNLISRKEIKSRSLFSVL